MAIFDVSLTLRNGMLNFPGDPVFSIESVYSRIDGDAFNLSLLSMTTHTGTHLDSPAHYLDGGETVDAAQLDVLIGNGIILDMRGKNVIDRQALQGSGLTDEKRVFLKTDNSRKLREPRFNSDYAYISESGAELLIERGIRLVGIDYLSVDRHDDEHAPAHKLLLSNGALIVEGLDLIEAPAGPCRIYCLPLKILDGDGAPARVLIETDCPSD